MARALSPIAATVLLLCLVAFPAPRASAETLEIVITSSVDAFELPDPPAECPHADRCTLRAAIELLNADTEADDYSLVFDPVVFSAMGQNTIVLLSALPPILRPNVTISGAGQTVRLEGDEVAIGLEIAAPGAVVRGLAFHGFGTACIRVIAGPAVVGGNALLGHGNRLGACDLGVDVGAADVTVQGNTIGFQADSNELAPVSAGVAVTASGALIGIDPPVTGFGNVIGNALAGVRVGTQDGLGDASAGVVVAANTIGETGSGAAAPVLNAIVLRQPSNGTLVRGNRLSNTTGSAVVIADDFNGVSTTGNTIVSNLFESIGTRAVDHRGDGVRNANDLDDSDGGPNNALNYPFFTNAVQGLLRGYAGPACAEPNEPCTIEVYFADHVPGNDDDNGSVPVPLAVIETEAGGSFTVNTPPVSPGDWLVALSTDAAGNTSEFGLPARVGTGALACGNVQLHPGWNHAGYFGPQSTQLGLVFPTGSQGMVRSIHALIDGETGFETWIENVIVGRTLETLVAPGAYWFDSKTDLTLQGGISVTEPLPVQLSAGWNDFVYVGAPADARDALASLGDAWTALYRYTNDGTTARWQKFGTPAMPDWARDFIELQPCQVYQLLMSEAATLIPLQP
ncbi:MAG: hypothetical protein WEC33_04770 [Dehalococcoidia bacterium]